MISSLVSAMAALDEELALARTVELVEEDALRMPEQELRLADDQRQLDADKHRFDGRPIGVEGPLQRRGTDEASRQRVDLDGEPFRGARIVGQPMWLASALVKIEGAAHRVPNYDAERNPATAHMFIINPLTGQGMDNLFATHPSTENRIAALQALAAEMGAGPGAPASGRSYPPRGPWGGGAKRGPWG